MNSSDRYYRPGEFERRYLGRGVPEDEFVGSENCPLSGELEDFDPKKFRKVKPKSNWGCYAGIALVVVLGVAAASYTAISFIGSRIKKEESKSSVRDIIRKNIEKNSLEYKLKH